MRGPLRPERRSTAGELMEPAETTTASRARMMALTPCWSDTRAPMQRRRDDEGVYWARVASVGGGAAAFAAKRRRSTLVRS